MKFSVVAWAFLFGQYVDDPWPIEKILKWASEAGYDGIDLCGFHMPSTEDVYDTPEKCKELVKLINSYGLEPASYAAWSAAKPAPVSANGEYMERVEKALRFCENCGIPTMRVDTSIPNELLSEEEYKVRFDNLVTNWRAASRAAASAGVTLVFESEPPMWLNKPHEVLSILEAVNEPNFKAIFDLSHAYLSCVKGARQVGEKDLLPGGLIEYINLLGKHIGCIHMTDTNGELSATDAAHTSEHLPLGEGILDLNAVIDALWPYAGDFPYWCLDFYATHDVGRTAVESLTALRGLLQGR